MSSEETSSLTVAKLKALCILNDLPTSGKKSELVERLLEFGLSKKEVGLPQQEVVEKHIDFMLHKPKKLPIMRYN